MLPLLDWLSLKMRDKHWRGCLRDWSPRALLVAMDAAAATVKHGVAVPQGTKDGAFMGFSSSIII